MSECRYCGRPAGVTLDEDGYGVCDLCESSGVPDDDDEDDDDEPGQDGVLWFQPVKADGTDAGNPAEQNDPGE